MKTTLTPALKRGSFTMAGKKRKRTNKSKYKHESTGDYCTCAAYVAEIMCKKRAEHNNQGSLSFKFWNNEPWKRIFQFQMRLATQILKDKNITERALVKAVNSDDFKRANIFSLKHPKAIGIIRRYQLLLDKETEPKQSVEVKKDAKHRKAKFGKKNILDTLRKLENGEEED